MEKPTPDKFNFRSGIVMRPDKILLTAGLVSLDENKDAHTVVMTWHPDEGWKGMKREWSSISVAKSTTPVSDFLVLGEEGELFSIGDSGPKETQVAPDKTVASIGVIGGRPYIAGMPGMLLRRTGEEEWEEQPLGLDPLPDFEAVAGQDAENLCAVGWGGAIVLIENGVETRVPSPTDVILTDVCLGGDGYYYICGQGGTLLRGRGDTCELIARDETEDDLWSVCWFRNQLLIASLYGVYVLGDDGKLEALDTDTAVMTSSYKLHALDDTYLLSVGADDVIYFDGTDWIMLT